MDEVRRELARAAQAVSVGTPEWAEARRALHTAKGAFGAMGLKSAVVLLHGLETLVVMLSRGSFNDGAPAIARLKASLEACDGAAILGDDAAFRQPLAELTAFLRTQSARPAAAPVTAVPQDDVVPMPRAARAAGHVLAVKVGRAECWIPAEAVDKVIYQPDILPVGGSILSAIESSTRVDRARLVRFAGCLMPLLSMDALLSDEDGTLSGEPSRLAIPWAVILKDPGGDERHLTPFCLPVDEVLGVRRAADASAEGPEVINFQRIRETARKLNP